MAQASLDPRLVEHAVQTFRRLRLQERDPTLHAPLLGMGASGRLDRFLTERLIATASSFEEALRDIPFLAAPTARVAGTVAFLRQYCPILPRLHGSPIGLQPEEICRHVMLSAGSGAGKSELLHTFLCHLRQTLPDVRVWIIDPKQDLEHWAVSEPDCLTVDQEFPYNMFATPSFVNRDLHDLTVIDDLLKTFYGGYAMHGALSRSIKAAREHRDHISPEDVARALTTAKPEKWTFKQADDTMNLATRWDALERTYPGMYRTRIGLTIEQLSTKHLYFPWYGPLTEVPVAHLIGQLFRYRKATQARAPLAVAIIIDEALGLFGQAEQHIRGTNVLAEFQSQVRELAIALIISVSSLANVESIVKSNTYTNIALATTNSKDAEAFASIAGLNREQAPFVSTRLMPGLCAIRLGHKWPEPLLATYEMIPRNKHVTPDQWTEATRRAHRLLPNTTETIVLSDTPETAQQEPEPTTQIPIPKEPKPELALTTNQRALLDAIASDPYQPSTTYYETCGSHPQQGHRDKIRLRSYGLIEQSYEVINNGRSGKACIVWATPAGYARLGKEPTPGTRGGGPWHNYAVNALRRLVNDATVEASVAGKHVDLLISASHNPAFITCVTEEVPDAIIPEDAMIAVEVEREFAQTGEQNLTQDLNAGLYVISAVRRYDLRRAQAAINNLPPEQQERAITIDIHDLIHQLSPRNKRTNPGQRTR